MNVLSHFSSRLRSYRKYRALQLSLNGDILEKEMSKELYEEAAAYLELWREGILVFESESECDLVQDFFLNDWCDDEGNTCVERYAQNHGPHDRDRNIVLDAMMASRTSLFRLEAVDPRRAEIHLRDVLHGELTTVIDFGLSQSAEAGVLLFGRVLPFPRFRMLSGASMIFPPEEQDSLAEIVERILQRSCSQEEKARRIFRKFFQRNRTRGMEVVAR
ncbi:hypothetical protein HY285_03485 [Candidatus Peregrinibacteria bacterium]|nr:hypothetical protein [Candidatus Peregrinibacteria bacterium]MBI3816578.1 hypothetical protein [Candidatus Peregrinibacteria bacterium]